MNISVVRIFPKLVVYGSLVIKRYKIAGQWVLYGLHNKFLIQNQTGVIKLSSTKQFFQDPTQVSGPCSTTPMPTSRVQHWSLLPTVSKRRIG